MTRLWLAGLLVVSAVTAAEEKQPPTGPPGTVSLPLPEYDRLVARAARSPKRPEPPPVPAVLSRAEIRVRVTPEAARGTMTIDGEVFRAGAVKVPLLAGATLLDARLGGRPLPLVSEGGTDVAVLTGPGPFSVALDWGTPLTTEPGRASFLLPVPQAGAVRATLELPGEQAEVRVEPGLVTRRTAAAGRTLIEVTLDPGSRTRVSWSAREAGEPARREARFLSDVKTLLSVGEADLRVAALVDVSVVQGQPQRFELRLPAGFELTGASGSSLERTEEKPGLLTLVTSEARSRHQFLVSLERASSGGSFHEDVGLPSLEGAQRETGEASVEALGTMELTAQEGDGMHRMDVREAHDSLKALAHQPLLVAFRYHRRAGDLARVALDVKRFPEGAVLAAVAERAVVTTLVTSEGRTLTEVALTVRNHAQPFLKVALPEGATLLSAEVAGEGVKPVKGVDGTRVPLQRPGFRPDGPYVVSFVYLAPGTPLGKKGDAQLGLPRMDVPVGLLEWELFLPDRYKVGRFGGSALRAVAVPPFEIEVGAMAETITVTAETPMVDTRNTGTASTFRAAPGVVSPRKAKQESEEQNAPSANVFNLQRRVAGVLPVRMDIPRAGAAYRFVRPLVLDEETTVSFRYKTR